MREERERLIVNFCKELTILGDKEAIYSPKRSPCCEQFISDAIRTTYRRIPDEVSVKVHANFPVARTNNESDVRESITVDIKRRECTFNILLELLNIFDPERIDKL